MQINKKIMQPCSFLALKNTLFIRFYSSFSKTIQWIIQRTAGESVMLKAEPKVEVEFEGRASVWLARKAREASRVFPLVTL